MNKNTTERKVRKALDRTHLSYLVSNYPNLQHKEYAEILGVSPSNVSRVIKEVAGDPVVNGWFFGKKDMEYSVQQFFMGRMTPAHQQFVVSPSQQVAAQFSVTPAPPFEPKYDLKYDPTDAQIRGIMADAASDVANLPDGGQQVVPSNILGGLLDVQVNPPSVEVTSEVKPTAIHEMSFTAVKSDTLRNLVSTIISLAEEGDTFNIELSINRGGN